MPNIYRERFFQRMATRKYRHGSDFRQVWIDCGGMCIRCGNVEDLEFHEPFGEAKKGFLVFQKRILLCRPCHNKEHVDYNPRELTEKIRFSQLNFDMALEIYMHNGYDNWIKDFNLVDRFGILAVHYIEVNGLLFPESLKILPEEKLND